MQRGVLAFTAWSVGLNKCDNCPFLPPLSATRLAILPQITPHLRLGY